ncbi:MAG: VWA domain-containing protein [Bacteroidetes bacterium]|nr:VWA domain-containing protein [Bacteroidota bacterium]
MFDFFNDITFANKELRWLFLVIPMILVWYLFKNKSIQAEIKTSSFSGFEKIKPSFKQYLRHLIIVIRLAALSALILVLMRPQSRSSFKDVKTEGIDIVIALDISSSMLAKDFKPNRLEAAEELAVKFIDSRPNDRIGLVIFSGESFTQCPLTSDHDVIKNLFTGIKLGMLADGTAIGNGLATSVSRIKDSKAKSKVVILLTDGVNNQGSVAPITAAEIAKAFGIRVYTIGLGTMGKALSFAGIYPDGSYAYEYADVVIDEKTLTEIADMTGAKYFRATDNDKLKEVYKEIDRLEKTIFEEKNFTNKSEHFLPFAIAAVILLLIEFLLKNTILKSIS